MHTYRILLGIVGGALLLFLTPLPQPHFDILCGDTVYGPICQENLTAKIIGGTIGVIVGVVVGSIADNALAKKAETNYQIENGEMNSARKTSEIEERLKELDKLKTAGLITEQEYETRRASILSKI